MYKTCISILLFFTCINIDAQVTGFEDQIWNFGEVPFWHNDTARFKVRNGTNRRLIFLPTYYNENFTVLFNNRAADPGETVEIGVVYYAQKKGKFDVEVPLYINQKTEPIKFHLRGNIKGFDPEAQLRCPSVNEGPSNFAMEKIVTIEVRDRQTEALLVPDNIEVSTRENKKVKLEKSNVVYQMSAVPGGYKVKVSKKRYDDYLALITLEPYQKKFVVYMDWTPDEPVRMPEPVKVTEDTLRKINVWNRGDSGDTSSVINKSATAEDHKHPANDSAINVKTKEPGTLSLTEYKLNNVILIIDVSSSMNRNGKLGSLKESFNVLVDALREVDKVAVITMNSEATVIQQPEGVTDKDSLKSRVANMKAMGGTNGGAALKMAYNLARANFDERGNNQIIIATDGIFYGGTLSRSEMEKMITDGNASGIHLSTVACGSDPKALGFLENLSAIGGGATVQVGNNSQNEAALLEMIKSQSRRK